MQNVISFPGLGIELTVNKIAFTVWGLSVHWYGVIIAVGFLLAVLYCYRRAPQFGLVGDDLIDLLIFAVPLSIIGARVYYVIFNYNTLYYYDHAAMFRIWDGGIAIYGAVIFGVLTTLVFAKIRHIRIGALLDVGALGLLIGQIIGRWGNFINQEAHGGETTLPWRMEIYDAAMGGRVAVHPTFLYESLWNLIGLLLLHFYSKRRKYNGEVFLMYVAWYGFGRGFIEGMRTDSLYFFGTSLRVSQFLGFFSCIVAVAVLIYMYLFREKDPESLKSAYLKLRKAAAGEGAAASAGPAPSGDAGDAAEAEKEEAEAGKAEAEAEKEEAEAEKEEAEAERAETGEKPAPSDEKPGESGDEKRDGEGR